MGLNSFAGQYADLLLGNVDQAYVAPRAQKVIQLITKTQAVLSGCDDGTTWWGNIYGNISDDGLSLTVDFSPKGGPPDVLATLTPAGNIAWTGNNAWERTSYYSNFGGVYNSLFQGDVLPQFPGYYEEVTISAASPAPPDATVGFATITAPGSWGSSTVQATIKFNQMFADFSAVGGEAYTVANLTQSGDILWLDSENMWERSLCSSGESSSSSSSDDSFKHDYVLWIGVFTCACGILYFIFGTVAYFKMSKKMKEDEGESQYNLMST